MAEQNTTQQFKRRVAYKYRIGQLNTGKPIFEEDRMKASVINGKEVSRVNIIANIVDKFIQEGEKKFGSLTLDDATGQIKLKFFGEDVGKMEELNQGDTILVIGILRSWNNEMYITPEIMKKKDPSFLLVRKLEVESDEPKEMDRGEIAQLKDKILEMIKAGESEGGIDIDKIITDLKEGADAVNKEIKKLLEEGIAYEPRPGKLRYLG
jgi:uncharacterized protein